MKKLCCVIMTICALVSLLAGCASKDPLAKLDIPDDCYTEYFSPVEGAVLYANGTTQQIASDDPRLIRVLNFIAYSQMYEPGAWTKGCVGEETINKCYASTMATLEINFAVDTENPTQGHKGWEWIIVCGSTFLEPMPDGHTYEGRNAVVHWPYSELAPEGTKNDMEWEEEPWLNILTYCGF